jgi:hypothetical protein
MKFIPKKVRDQVANFRGKVEGPLVNVVQAVIRKDWVNTKIEALHAINTVFNRNEGDNTFGRVRGFRKFEIEALSSIWFSKEEQDEMMLAVRHFQRTLLGPTRGSRMKAGTALQVNLSPAATEEEAIQLVRSRKYKWITKNGIMCLAPIEEPDGLMRVVGGPLSVDRLST